MNSQKINRRNAIKMLTFLGAYATTSHSADTIESNVTTPPEPVAKMPAGQKVVIIGGGVAGISIAHKLLAALTIPDVTIIEPNDTEYYQADFPLIFAGVKPLEAAKSQKSNYIPQLARWIKATVVSVNPIDFKITLSNGTVIGYDYLVVACGAELNYSKIIGCEEALKDTKSGVFTIYQPQYLQNAYKIAQEFNGKKAIFTTPNTQIKCRTAPISAALLFADIIKSKDSNASVEFFTPSTKMVAISEYSDIIAEQTEHAKIKNNFGYMLTEIKADKKIAVFEKRLRQDKALESQQKEKQDEESQNVEIPYDILHVVPPMSAPAFLINSGLCQTNGTFKGWLKVDKETLQHLDYPNIFGAGDVCGIPLGKTIASTKKQGTTLVDNLILAMQNKTPTRKYGGQGSCVLYTSIGKASIMEFDYKAKYISSFPLDSTQPRWLWWAVSNYISPFVYWHITLMGRA